MLDDRGAAQADQLSLRLPTSEGYGIRAQVEITLHVGLLLPHQPRTESRVGHLDILPL